jgi:2-oxo-3-hexenedioate decarboxylase
MKEGLNLNDITQEMKAAQDQLRQIKPFTSRFTDFSIKDAYEVALRIHKIRIDEGAVPVGRKIGFTNPEMWAIYDVNEPIWAYIYDKTVIRLTGSKTLCHIGQFIEPKIEPEIVVHFRSTPLTAAHPEEILECIDWVAHGIEIVQSHFPGWEFQAADTIADGGLHGTLLVGEPQEVNRLGTALISDLERFVITLSCNGEVCGQGRGSNVLGSPLMAIAHLIKVIQKQPNALPLLQVK